jgi:hypothetical protein
MLILDKRAPRKTVASGGNGVGEALLYESTAGPPWRSIAGLAVRDASATRSRFFDVHKSFTELYSTARSTLAIRPLQFCYENLE